MRILVIGGGRFLASPIVEELVYDKHDVALFDSTPPPVSVASRVTYFVGDKSSLSFYREEFHEFKPDVAVHLTLSNKAEAKQFVDLFKGLVSHLVVTSNTNVYLAHGRMRQTEPGPSLAVPIDERSQLRQKQLKEDESGDKVEVESVIRTCGVGYTILRLAPLYGPFDFARRFYPLMIRMIDARPHIMLGACQADWRWSHAFVDDAAHAIVLAATNPARESRIFNVAEQKTPTMKERTIHIATVFGWEGRVGVVPDSALPDYMRTPGDFTQDLLIDSTRIRQELHYKEKTDYYDGLSAAVEWYRDNPPPKLAGQKFNYSAEDSLNSVAF